MIPYRLRKANMKDISFILSVRNDKTMRKNSINSKKIFYSEHEKFYNKHYNEYQIIEADVEDEEMSIGYIRNNEGMISISILPKYRNYGIGTDILSKLKKGRAIILLNNYASIKAFLKSGFKIKGFYLEK